MKLVRAAGRAGIISALAIVAAFSVCAPAFAGGMTRIADGVHSYVDARSPLPATSFGAKAREMSAKANDADAIAAELIKALPKREYFDMFIAAGVKTKYLRK